MPTLPIIFTTKEDSSFISDLENRIKQSKGFEYLLDFPIVYIHYWAVDKISYVDKDGVAHSYDQYDVYVGESNNVISRTRQHFKDGVISSNWQYGLTHTKNGCIPDFIVIGHEHFNKSFTLDLENRLIEYILSIPNGLRTIHNGRGNPQNNYYTADEFKDVFQKVWAGLQKHNITLFPPESVIFDSAIFKASPLKKLTAQQQEAKELIVERVKIAISKKKSGQLVFVQGEAGTGKTVLTTSTFYELLKQTGVIFGQKLNCHLIVNHDEQLSVYEQIAKRLNLGRNVVSKPTSFINKHDPSNKVDVCFIDEGHLLLTQGKMSYRGKNQLEDIMQRAKVTVIMFDEYQILTTEEYWEPDLLESYKRLSIRQKNFINLSHQFRMQCADSTAEWLKRFVIEKTIDEFKEDEKGYEVKAFDSPEKLFEAIKLKAGTDETKLSRMVATYDWEYSSDNRPIGKAFWDVNIGGFSMPWNYELLKTIPDKERRHLKKSAWAEQPHTIDEIGSTFTIQGFDLSYVGVILGKSVQYKNGRIVFNPLFSKNYKATQNRTLSNGHKCKFGSVFIRNEVKVLLSRGVKGLYIYAVDKGLRNALKTIAKI
ncbi:MAG: DUF2075 domain-containing protein [Bacteroidales bacterium]|nr:DUF2075 domain-containing protein [Bacteroidales bacterium]